MFKRTHSCGELTEKDFGKKAALCGWVHTWRDHGGLVFIDLRDRDGMTQIVFNPEKNKEMHTESRKLRSEYVVAVKGIVEPRPKGTENNKLKTGKVEVAVEELKVLNTAEPPPFEISDDAKISEEVRLNYRYLDLRRPCMQRNLRIRHNTTKAMRDFLDENGFLEVETPILTKSTPEGARDYLVPSRLNPGKFYALPQSPQLFKQILMVAGYEKYFQIAKCFRDEDLRADRQPEFTQLDIEMSFVDVDDILALTEGLFKYVIKKVTGVNIKTPFPRLTYDEAMSRFGTDKPDTRFGMEISELRDIFEGTEFNIFKTALEPGGSIFGINVSGFASASRKDIDDLTAFAKDNGAKGLAYIKFTEAGAESPILKFVGQEKAALVQKKIGAQTGDLVLIVADAEKKTALEVLGALRLYLAKIRNIKKEEGFNILWVLDFPLLKYNKDEKKWDSEHHPFTSCRDEDIPYLDKEPGRPRAKAYDIVINGMELGSGSIRIHRKDMQEKMFNIIGLSKEEAEERFGFLLKAFEYGAPPHGGIAFGLDRLITIFTGTDTIRDVIAFPKTQKAVCLMTDAPSDVDERQLKELGMKIPKKENGKTGPNPKE
ncbi:MAG: aspartate--tRNA ligase [Candidatus Omnitrophica bacterium]|nr:aspartate--tRNA ligase [Candidatus Omnitrophota bacterium]MBU4488762.1 aspartate--tRNA ligase [Candidatus Omnitrophota bacterium]MCG2705859.1 aspartate--tRNA ligase [Candidatus Omnitrophota bacterium]